MVKPPVCMSYCKMSWQHLWTGPMSDSSLCFSHSPEYGRKSVNICWVKEQIFGRKVRGRSKLWRLRTQHHGVTEQQDRDGFVLGQTGEVKNVLFQRSTGAKLYKVKWSQPPSVYSKWSMPSSPEPRVAAILKSSRTYCCLPKSCKHFEGQCGSTFLSDPFLSRTHLGSHGRRPSLLPLGLSSDSLNLYFLIQFLKSW